MDPKAYAENNKPEAGAALGIYTHPNTTEELHAATFPAADAFVRQGWVWSKPLPKAVVTRKVVGDATVANADEVKEVKAQLREAKVAQHKAEQDLETEKAAKKEDK